MQTEPIITWRNMPHSGAVDEIVHTRIKALEKFNSKIIGCEVVIDAPQKRGSSGRGIDVRIHLRLPGPDLDVARSVRQGEAADDVTLAVNKAFSALERQLKERSRVMDAHEVKHHPSVLHGEIIELENALGYVWVRADDGREVYFQKDGLITGTWDALELGDRLN